MNRSGSLDSLSPSSASTQRAELAVRSRRLVTSSIAVLLILAAYSVYLAFHRIYQVDEFQNFYMARVQAMGQYKELFTNSSLFLFGPLSWLATSHLSSAGMITGARLVFLVVFWINLLLVARIAGGPLLSGRGLAALVGAATLTPLWDYGFEVRHDNLVLTGILLIWWLARARPAGVLTYIVAGVVTVALLFTAVKAVVYVVPLSFAIIVFPPPGSQTRWKAAAAWLAGAAVAVVLVRVYYGTSGAWDNYLSVFRTVSKYSSSASSGKFPPWETLERLLTESALLLAITVAALIAVTIDLLHRKKGALTWDGLLPEALLFLGALGALVINPTPFAYNLVNLVPFAFILAFRYAMEAAKGLQLSRELWIFIAALLIVVHFTPFTVLTCRHVYFPNTRQKQLMRLAEQMTDPANDLVYDGIGMVPTRRSADFYWYLHSLAAERVNTGIRDILRARPAAVFIRSYRTDWLPEADDQFINSRYVPLSDEFEVLGTVLPAGGGSFEIVHAGRYCIVPASSFDSRGYNSRVAATNLIAGALDGMELSNRPVELAVGKHQLQTSSNATPAVVWVGPTLNSLPDLGPGDHRFLFQNWY